MASPRLRVLHIIQNLNYGGMERLLSDLVRRSDSGRFESHVLALQYLGRFAEGLQGMASLHTAGHLPSWTMISPGPLARQIEAIAPDVVHLHSGVWYKASLAARRARVPLVIHTEHGRRAPDPWLFRVLDARAASRTDVVVAVSGRLAQQLERTVVRGRSRIEVICNGVDCQVYAPRADTGRVRRELGLAQRTPILGSIGRLEPIKGYDIMVEAFGLLLSGWPQTELPPHLVIAGDGSARKDLERRIERLGLAGTVHLLGWRDDVQDLLSAFCLFTMSSRSEGTSVSLLEAMSSGLCPVVTSVGGNAAVLGSDLRHRLVRPEDPVALADAWREALQNTDARTRDAETASARVRERFGLDQMVRAYERLYQGG